MFLKYFFIIIIFFFSFTLKACEKPSMPTEAEWTNWLKDVKNEAINIGISVQTINSHLSDVKPQKKIILRDRCQPESTITLKEYLYYRVDKSRIIAGKNILKEYEGLLSEISNHFGIQERFIICLLYTSPSPRDGLLSRMPSSA